MSRSASFVSLAGIKINRDKPEPIHRQLYSEIRGMILSGHLPAGARLPPTRILCDELAISRSTVVEAVAQLTAEGYVVGQTGRGTFVSETLPEQVMRPPVVMGAPPTETNTASIRLSERGLLLTAGTVHPDAYPRPFLPGLPDTVQFPTKHWGRILGKHWKNPPKTLGYDSGAGYLPLREAIADHARLSRRVNCTPEQVIITSGAQQALFMCAQMFATRGDQVWVENPGYGGAFAAFATTELDLVPIPVDQHGIDVEAGIRLAPKARLAYVTPSHQYPAGGTLDISRRLRLLEWAKDANSLILEDDYDSEYRYTGHPLESLQGLDKNGQVIYIGTFSKTIFPSLRLGYVIVPKGLERAFAKARYNLDRGSERIMQMALNDFMREGHFTRHIRRMRLLYAKRQQVMVDAIREYCGDWLEVAPAPAGLHLVGWLAAGVDDVAVAAEFAKHEIFTPPLSSYSIAPLERGGLVMGYAGVPEDEIVSAVKQMGQNFQAQKLV
ncbi:MAG: PLP-dependent aminotransferase family protein [Anaerolineae bacterium]